MPQFAAAIALSALDGTNGFALTGAAAGDYAGISVASAGDVNGDGFADLIIGAHRANTNGAAYIVLGKASGFDAALNLSTLDSSTGFQLNGLAAQDDFGAAVAGAGDVNGDGFADILIGAPRVDASGHADSGAAYVLFGSASGFASLSTLNGTNGFALLGAAVGDNDGASVFAAGDVNGDGFGDLIVGAPLADPNGYADAGASYVVFGKPSGFGASLDLAALNGTTGFRLAGHEALEYSGFAVSTAGDINGDGFADLLVGAYRASPHGSRSGASFVVFGKASGFAATLDLSTLNGTSGFKLSGAAKYDYSGLAVSAAGDINGDGYGDIAIAAFQARPHGALSGTTYIVFGKAAGFTANIDLSTLDGSNGFALTGAAGEQSGFAVANAGDVNGDGYDDLIIGAQLAKTNGKVTGAAYVLFGKAGGFAASVDLASLNGDTGFRIDGAVDNSSTGRSVAGAGDVNGDGFADLLIGAPRANTDTGTSYVVFGHQPLTAVTRSGTALANTIHGGALADTLSGLGADDHLIGHDGNDALKGGSGDDTLDGGIGLDTADFSDASAAVTVSAALASAQNVGGDLGTDTLFAIENLTGSAFNDILTGSGAANILTGGNGDDRLDGAASADTLVGGTGNDTYFVDDTHDAIVEAVDGGSDTVFASVAKYVLAANIENLVYTGTAAVSITGNALANQLSGAAANDMLDGGTGGDTLTGGKGDDTYMVDDVHDTIMEAAKGGTDTVKTALAQYVLGTNVENLIYTGKAAIAATGNSAVNALTGGKGADTLDGGSGADVLTGGAGNDTYIIDNAKDKIVEGANAGTDTVKTALKTFTLGDDVENLTFTGTATFKGTGNALANTITGGKDNDTLTGGLGADHLTGGAGADTFVYAAANQSTGPTFDTITSFDAKDHIDLKLAVKAIDTAITTGRLSTATFDHDLAAAATASHLAAHHAVLFTASSGTDKGATFLIVDLNGAAGYQSGADLVIHLDRATTALTTHSFV